MTKKNIIVTSIIVIAIWLLALFIFKTVVPAVAQYKAGQKIVAQINDLSSQQKTLQVENANIQKEFDRCSAYQLENSVLLSGNMAQIADLENKKQQLWLQYNDTMGFTPASQ